MISIDSEKNENCFCCKGNKNNKEIYFHTDNFLQDKRIVLCEQCLADLSREVDRALI